MKRYSPTKVSRYAYSTKTLNWELVETFEDATVRDQGDGNFLRAPEAMLRAYPSTSELAKAWDKHDEWFVCDDERVKHYGESLKGFVLDCDGDIALKRISGILIAKHSYGHANEEWIMLVNYDEDDEEYNGWGDYNKARFERWYVSLPQEDD